MPSWKAILPSAALAAAVLAQDMPIPEMSSDILCDGTIRPDYDECENDLLPQTFGGMTVGPGIMEGQTIKGNNCQFRSLKCGDGTAGEFTLSDFSSMYPLVEHQCGEYPAGGVYRSGDACIYIDTPNNTFGGTTKRGAADDAELPVPVPTFEREATKQARRDLVREAQALLEERQCDPPDEPCYTYTEQVYLTGVRGHQQRVCDNILPNGARCDQSRAVTTGESFSVGADVSTGIKDVVDVSASFSDEVSTSSTQTITTAITITCPNGGYVVWYPLMEVSKGECGQGPRASCSGGCITTTTAQCEYQKPIASGKDKLSGEYDIQCV
ncbi:hypothetical protein SLS62_008822 [Diatrype stigma]|uniref:Uncharacterized protein n=1 Tax=Diatrype stigma TaxID=117547 RepID=A0AAN9YKR3_9PEZI